MIRLLKIFLMLLAGLIQGSPAQGQDVFVDMKTMPDDESVLIGRYVSYWDAGPDVEDTDVTSGRYDADFKVFDQDMPGRGFMTNAMWLRLVVKHDGLQPEVLYFNSRYPITDTVQFFQKNEAGVWQSERQGDLNPERVGRASYRTPIMKMRVAPGTNTYYIKLQTQGSIVLALYLAKPDAMRRFQIYDSAAIALFFGIMITLLLYNGFLTLSFRSVTYFYYFLFVLNMLFVQAALQGLWPVFLPGAWGTWEIGRAHV